MLSPIAGPERTEVAQVIVIHLDEIHFEIKQKTEDEFQLHDVEKHFLLVNWKHILGNADRKKPKLTPLAKDYPYFSEKETQQDIISTLFSA